jgi:hypothetical protein
MLHGGMPMTNPFAYCATSRRPGPRAGALQRFSAAITGSLLFCLLWPASALATLLDASYDAGENRLVLEIAYQGTNPNHQFVLEWGSCQKAPNGNVTTVARLIDSDGHDIAREDYRVWRHFDLSAMPCRPAEVTIRLGPVSNRTVLVPALKR